MSLPLRIAAYATGATIFLGTAYITGITYAPAPRNQVSNELRQQQFERLAPDYETKTRQQEWYLGIGRMRRSMLKEHASGRTLEVGCGTGHNIGLYPSACSEVVLCDRSGQMVQATGTKIRKRLGYEALVYDGDSAQRSGAAIRQLIGIDKAPADEPAAASSDAKKPTDASTSASPSETAVTEYPPAPRETPVYSVGQFSTQELPFPDNSFDTVVDVFSLCSYDDPVQALNEMSRVVKPNGTMVLLEHGRGTWGQINWYLDKWAPRHAAQWGCWWNRDIRRFIRMSGCQVVSREEKHFGTTSYMILKPRKPRQTTDAATAKK